jgi:hypothetical protein
MNTKHYSPAYRHIETTTVETRHIWLSGLNVNHHIGGSMEKGIMSTKIRNKYTRRTGELKKRNPEKVVMDRYYHPKTFRSRKQELQELDADYEIQEYFDDYE